LAASFVQVRRLTIAIAPHHLEAAGRLYVAGDAAVMTAIPGSRVTYKTSHFKEYTVAARDARVLRVTDQRGKPS